MYKYLFTFLLCITTCSVSAQIDANSVITLPNAASISDLTSITGYNSGSIAFVVDEAQIYMFNGTIWVPLIDGTDKNRIDNELFFEDPNYYYVSVLVNTNDWMVTRFDRTDINIEDNAMGTGIQPTDLATVAGLAY